jgi:hypothetical protein
MTALPFKLRYFLKLLLMAVAAPACLIWLGTLVMSVLEPKPEFGGYVHQWSRDIRFIIFILSVGIGFKCSAIHLQEHDRRFKSIELLSNPSLSTRLFHRSRFVKALLILLIIPTITASASSWFIYEQTLGGCDLGL